MIADLLQSVSFDALLAEMVRRRNATETDDAIEQFCEGCKHFKCYAGSNVKAMPDTYNPCQRKHVMLFRMPEEHNWPNSGEWGHYRRACPDFVPAPEPKSELPARIAPQRPRTYEELCAYNERLQAAKQQPKGKTP